MRVSIFNTNSFPITNAAWTDNLVSIQPGIYIANPANMTNNCGGTVVATPLSTTLSLSGGTIPAQVGVTPGACYVEIDVTSITPGNLVNNIPVGGLTGTGGGGTVSNTTPASATLRVSTVNPPTVSKSFTPNTVFVGQTSVLAITVRNNDLNTTLTQASVTDNLPLNVTIVNPPAATLTNCGTGATVTAVNGTGTITLNNASIPPNSNCIVRVTVVSSVTDVYTNTIPANAVTTQQGVTNAARARANLNVQAVRISKAFNPASFQAGGTSTLTITLQNPTANAYTNVSLADTLPSAPPDAPDANVTVVPGSATTTCTTIPPAPPANVFTTLPRTVTLTGGRVPPGTITAPGTCTITVQVTAPAGTPTGSYINRIPAGAMTSAQGVTNVNAANATVSVYAAGAGVTATKTFNPATITPGQNSRLRILITAPPDTALTNFRIADNLPPEIIITNSTVPAVVNCGAGAVLTALTNTSVITLTNGTIPAGTTCRIDVYVTSRIAGPHLNSIPPANITNNENRTTTGPINATLTVSSTSDLSMSKAFYPPAVAPNGLSTLTITLQNTNPSPLINASLTDPLPMANATNGVFAAPTPNIRNTCGGTVAITTTSGQDSVVLSGGTIPAQAGTIPGICTITLDVIGRGANAVRTNTIPVANVSGTIQSSGVTIQPVAQASAPLRIANLTIGVIKGFNPLTVFGGSASTMSIQLINPNNYLLTGIHLTDNMPAGMILANPPNFNTGTCGGTVTGTPDTSTFTFSGGSLAANTTCFITASVTMTVNANLTNSIPAGSVTTFNGAANPQIAEATLTNLPGASVSKVFLGNPINAGGIEYSTLVITIRNTGNTPITGMGLIDNLPGTLPNGLVIAGSPAPAAGNTCNGTLTADPGTQLIQLTGGTMGSNATCALSVPVTGQVPGSYTNTIPTGALTNDQDATNGTPATDTLTLNAVPALSVAKNLTSAVPTVAGGTLTYDIIVTNTGNANLTGVVVTDPGVGVVLGTCTPPQPAALAPGSLMTCPASHVVTQADINTGSYSNTAIGDSDQTGPATDTRVVNFTQAPGISLVKTGAQSLNIVPPAGVANPGDQIAYTFAVTNSGNVTLTNVSLADTIGGVILSGGPIASLEPGATDSTTFTGLYTLTQADIDKGTFTNTATASGTTPGGSIVTGPSSDTQTLTSAPAISLVKTGTLHLDTVAPATIPNAGDTITYTFAVTNTGIVTLSNVTLADTIGGVTIMGGPIPTLAPGATDTTTFTGLYTLTQADVNNGSFTNTATVTGTAPDGTRVSAVDDDVQTYALAPAIALVKTGTLHVDTVAPVAIPNAGDTITYTFAVTNTGNVPLTNITVADTVGGVTIAGGPIASLAPGVTDSTTFTGLYTLTQADINKGSFTNIATTTGTAPGGTNVTAQDDDTQVVTIPPMLGVAKRVVGTPAVVSQGTWDVTYAILVQNFGSVSLANLQVVENLAAAFPAPAAFTVRSVNSTVFHVNPGFNGSSVTNLLAGTDTLAAGASGEIVLVVRVTPKYAGPFYNSATSTATDTTGKTVTDTSQNGTKPDGDGDGIPTDDNTPTPVSFSTLAIEPPFGIKLVNAGNLPRLRWTVIWINNKNTLAINASSSDGIPAGTSFFDNGVPSGYPLPAGTLPAGSTASGVACEDTSTITTTTACYYEGPTTAYPRGRIVWTGVLGPDFGISDPAAAVNEIRISFNVKVADSTKSVANTATIDVDRNGDGDTNDAGEVQVANAAASWSRPSATDNNLPANLPVTGFAQGRVTGLPAQPKELAYTKSDNMTLEIPAIGLNAQVVGVPLTDAGWQLDWLGGQVGYLEGTAFPTWNGNSVLTAHVYNADGNPGPFVDLRKMGWGQKIIIHAWGQAYTYEVRSVLTRVSPNDTSVLKHEIRPWLTLITCQGYDEKSDSYRWRVVVRAVLVDIQ